MWRIWAAVPLITLSLLNASQAFAGESTDWVVRKATGLVEYSMAGGEGVAVEAGDFLAPGMSIHTGANGRARLERGEEWVLILPNTLVTVLAQPDVGMDTTLKVETGKIGIHVQKQTGKHFSVGAPNLVAVVKGTTFTVSADPDRSEVGVIEGLVEVRSHATQEARDVRPGEVASVGSAGSISVNNRQSDSSNSGPALLASELEIFIVPPDEADVGVLSNESKKDKAKGKGKSSAKGKTKGKSKSGQGEHGGHHGRRR